MFIHVSICFLTQATTSSLAYQLTDLTVEQQKLKLDHENLTLKLSSKTALTNIYPQIQEKKLQKMSQDLGLSTNPSFALLSN